MEVSVTCVNLLLVFLLATHASSQQELNSTLHSTIYSAPVAYVDEMVTFTCAVTGSNSMAWTSNQYIGTGGQLELSAAETVGTRQTAVGNPQTVAELIAIIGDIIVSRLNITIQSNFPTASVQCHNINAGTNTSLEFLLEDTTSIDCDKQSVCPGETVTCTCTTGNSNMLTWTNNGNSLTFASSDPLGTRRDLTGSNTYAVLADTSDTNGISVITSNLTFVASSFGSSVVLTCANVDLSTSGSVIIPVSDFSVMTIIGSCTDPSGQVTTPSGNADTSTGDTCFGPIIAAVVVPVFIALVAVSTIIIVLIVWRMQYKKQDQEIKEQRQEIQELETKLKTEEDKVTALSGQNEELRDRLGAEQQKVNSLKKKERSLREDLANERKTAATLRDEKNWIRETLNDKISSLEKQLRQEKYRK